MADNEEDDLQDEGHVYLFDRREGDRPGVKISLGGLFDFSLFRCKVNEVRVSSIFFNLSLMVFGIQLC